MNIKTIFLVTSLFIGSINASEVIQEQKTNNINAKEVSKKIIISIGNVIKVAYNNIDNVFSRKTALTIGLLAWPYFKLYPEHLIKLTNIGSRVVINLNGMIAQGIVEGLANNPKAITQLLALMTVKETGLALAKGIGTAVASIFLFKK